MPRRGFGTSVNEEREMAAYDLLSYQRCCLGAIDWRMLSAITALQRLHLPYVLNVLQSVHDLSQGRSIGPRCFGYCGMRRAPGAATVLSVSDRAAAARSRVARIGRRDRHQPKRDRLRLPTSAPERVVGTRGKLSSRNPARLVMTLLLNIDVPDVETGVRFYTRAFDLKVSRRFGAAFVELSGWPAAVYLLAKQPGTVGAGGDLRRYGTPWTPAPARGVL